MQGKGDRQLRVGFTGSRSQPTTAQLSALRVLLHELGATVLHHGCCVGSDTAAHVVAQTAGLRVVGHPPEDQRQAVMDMRFDELRPPLPFLERNRVIVAETERLVALPDGPERVRSGTWATVREAVRRGKKVAVVYSDGQVELR